MILQTEKYVQQVSDWPQHGRHILAQHDDDTVIVYQAYRPQIGHAAANENRFGGHFSYNRMSWIKPNFLWMMYRSGWGCKTGQEVILAVRLRRPFFEEILIHAVPAQFDADRFESIDSWRLTLKASQVRVQWDPDRDPCGAPLARRAIQLGLRGRMLERYGKEEIVDIQDISEFVAQQRSHAIPAFSDLEIPQERTFRPDAEEASMGVGIERI